MFAALITAAAKSGGRNSDLNSLGSIHYGSGFWNSADPLNIFGNSGSNLLANATNPMGSGLISGNIPNNGVNPVASARWAGPGISPLGAYAPMQSGMSPQQMAMLSKMGGAGGNNPLSTAFNNYLSAIGQPAMPLQPVQNQGGGSASQLASIMQNARGGMPGPMRGSPVMRQF